MKLEAKRERVNKIRVEGAEIGECGCVEQYRVSWIATT